MTDDATKKPKCCFVVMPISDPEGYSEGHFARVYKYITKPACDKIGISCIRADEVKSTNYIVIDVLNRILDSDLIVCDLSSRNPNVLYELGVRQAFNLPTVLIKDKQTERIFDIQGLRTLDYDQALRVDTVKQDISALSASIKETLAPDPKDVNSLVQLLGVRKAVLSPGTEISGETSLVLNALRDLSHRITGLEEQQSSRPVGRMRRTRWKLPSGNSASLGESVFDGPGGTELGYFDGIDDYGILIRYLDGEGEDSPGFIVPPDSEQYERVTTVPF